MFRLRFDYRRFIAPGPDIGVPIGVTINNKLITYSMPVISDKPIGIPAPPSQ